MNSDDPYLDPAARILKNIPGIEEVDELEKYERLYAGMRQLTMPTDIPMTEDGYKAIHNHLFQDVYDWAGEYRTVNLVKQAEENVEFERGPFVKPNMGRIFGELQCDDHLRGLDEDTYAYRAAVYMEDFNRIHPFREGNGRTQRLFLKELTSQAGHELDLTGIERAQWIDASKAGFEDNHGPMTECIRGALAGKSMERDDSRQSEPEPEPVPDPGIAPGNEEIPEPGIATDLGVNKGMER